MAERLAAFWPAPLTIIFEVSARLSHHVALEGKEVGIRISPHFVARRIPGLVGCPVCATSANLSGSKPARRVEEIPDSLIKRVDFVIDYGVLEGTEPSSVVKWDGTTWRYIRKGAFQLEGLIYEQ